MLKLMEKKTFTISNSKIIVKTTVTLVYYAFIHIGSNRMLIIFDYVMKWNITIKCEAVYL